MINNADVLLTFVQLLRAAPSADWGQKVLPAHTKDISDIEPDYLLVEVPSQTNRDTRIPPTEQDARFQVVVTSVAGGTLETDRDVLAGKVRNYLNSVTPIQIKDFSAGGDGVAVDDPRWPESFSTLQLVPQNIADNYRDRAVSLVFHIKIYQDK